MSDPSSLLDREQFGSAADYAYAALKREIVEGRFAPGRRMREIELADLLGISRTPTRHALARLELEGLLELRPRSGLIVTVLDFDAVTELYEMRASLEGAAAAMAAKHGSSRDFALLSKLIADEKHLKKDAVSLYRHNRTLHEAIHAGAHNRYLEQSLSALQDSIALLGPTTLASPGRATIARAEHEAIVDAITHRDDAKADRLARAHILGALDVRRVILSKQQKLNARQERDSA